MKVFALIALFATLLTSQVLAADPKDPKSAPAKEEIPATPAKEIPGLTTKAQKLGYIFGTQVGTSMREDGVDVDPVAFAKGFADALAGKESQLSAADAQTIFVAFKREMQAKMAAKEKAEEDKRLAASVKNQKEGDAWLADNKKKEGVKVTESGLQYKIIKDGTGAKPKLSDTVTANYEGHLIDGTVFDSSYKRGEAAKFPVDGVIKGWTEALQMMKVGSKWEVYIPSQLGYGEDGAGADIGPNAALVFTIELLDTTPAKPKIKIEQ